MDRETALIILNAEDDPKKKKKFDEMDDEELVTACKTKLKGMAKNEESELIANAVREGFDVGEHRCVWNEEAGEIVCTPKQVDNEDDQEEESVTTINEKTLAQQAPELMADVMWARKERASRRQRMVDQIVENSDLDKDFLANMDDSQLEVLTNQFKAEQTEEETFGLQFAGQAPLSLNDGKSSQKHVLPIPTMNFDEAG